MDSKEKNSGWQIATMDGGFRFPVLMHPTELKFINFQWEDVPEEILKTWAIEGEVEAIFELGKKELERQNYESAWNYFSKGSILNDGFCSFYLGVMLDEGLGIGKNKNLAIKQFEKAAELGHVDSQYNLGQIYLKGDGVKQNIHKAIHYYIMAANQGDLDSNFNLGVIYSIGDLIPKDLYKATSYFEFAASKGHPKAKIMLERCKQEFLRK